MVHRQHKSTDTYFVHNLFTHSNTLHPAQISIDNPETIWYNDQKAAKSSAASFFLSIYPITHAEKEDFSMGAESYTGRINRKLSKKLRIEIGRAHV